MTQHTFDGTEEAERKAEEQQDFRSYVLGYGLALVLTLIPFSLVYWNVLARPTGLVVIGILAVVQMIVHFRFFLHIGLKRRREDLHLILFSTLLLMIMIAGTIWIMVNLSARMTSAMP